MNEEALFSDWASRMDQAYAPFYVYEDFKAAQEAPMYTFDADTVSDLHKDAYGFRPSGYWWTMWEEASDLRRQEIWDDLIDALRMEQEYEAERHARAIDRFEHLVAKTIEHGARDRETALRWIMDASICNGDWEFLCHEHGLPYGFFNKREAA